MSNVILGVPLLFRPRFDIKPHVLAAEDHLQLLGLWFEMRSLFLASDSHLCSRQGECEIFGHGEKDLFIKY